MFISKWKHTDNQIVVINKKVYYQYLICLSSRFKLLDYWARVYGNFIAKFSNLNTLEQKTHIIV